ncbi:MAG: hypothetical protein ABSE16_07855 [Verrucomicrobiota bacterium]|jgi:hypothetical protein
MSIAHHQLPALCVGAVLALVGCEQHGASNVEQLTVQEKVLPHPNLTNYEFDASVSDVTNAIKKAFGTDWYLAEAKKHRERVWEGRGDATTKHALTLALQSPPPSLFFKGDADALSKNLLTKAGNENDAYLFGSTSPVSESQVYFKDGQPLIYYADFHIHLTALGAKKCSVDIFTYDSSVVAGVDESWSPHGPSFIFVEVPPTTIEQYQILLGIGQQLGVTNMPPLVVPGPDAPVKELTLPRER